MALKVARRGGIAPFIVMDVMQAANARDLAAKTAAERCVHLEVGQPGTPAPRAVGAAAAALDSERLGYTLALGIDKLRARIAGHYRDSYGVDVPPERIIVTTGSSGAFLLSFLAAFDHGDRVALADPGYPAYRNILQALGIAPVGVVADHDTRFQPTPALLDRVDGPIHGLIVASPANPTGSMMAPEELAAVAHWCRARGVRLISDEIYHGITYGTQAATALAFSDEAIVINSFSKYFSMTGWRLGWMIVPPDLLRAVEVLAQNLYISPPTLPQLAAVAAFDARDELDGNVARYRANRDLLLQALPEAGFTRFAPADGAFYLYADVAHMTNDSEAFCKRMLAETGVAATPGTDFDPGRGRHFVRFSYAGTTEDMLEAARRLKAWRR